MAKAFVCSDAGGSVGSRPPSGDAVWPLSREGGLRQLLPVRRSQSESLALFFFFLEMTFQFCQKPFCRDRRAGLGKVSAEHLENTSFGQHLCMSPSPSVSLASVPSAHFWNPHEVLSQLLLLSTLQLF